MEQLSHWLGPAGFALSVIALLRGEMRERETRRQLLLDRAERAISDLSKLREKIVTQRAPNDFNYARPILPASELTISLDYAGIAVLRLFERTRDDDSSTENVLMDLDEEAREALRRVEAEIAKLRGKW